MAPHRFESIIDELEISSAKKHILKKRFVQLVIHEKRRAFRITIFYYLGHTIVSVGSLIVPALLSIQYTGTPSAANNESFTYQIYWTTWVVSLCVTTFNALITLFKIDKKYLYLNTNKELLASEGWQYIGLSGRYSGFFTPGVQATHDNQFIFFCHRIEKLRLHEIEDEFSRMQEQKESAGHTPPTEKKEPFNPPTPLNLLENNTLKAEINKMFDSHADIEITPTTVEDVRRTSEGKVSVSLNLPKSSDS
jgi:hypothetical protein